MGASRCLTAGVLLYLSGSSHCASVVSHLPALEASDSQLKDIFNRVDPAAKVTPTVTVNATATAQACAKLNDCNKHGICFSDVCLCDPGWKGETCNMADNNCPKGCSGHGQCDTTTNMCFCEAGWTSEDCSQQANVEHIKPSEPSVQSLISVSAGSSSCSKDHGVMVNGACFCDLGYQPPNCEAAGKAGTARGGSDVQFWSGPLAEPRASSRQSSSFTSLFNPSGMSPRAFVNPFLPSSWGSNNWGFGSMFHNSQPEPQQQARLLPDGSFAPTASQQLQQQQDAPLSFNSFVSNPDAIQPDAAPAFQPAPQLMVPQAALPPPAQSFQSFLPASYGIQAFAQQPAPLSAVNPFLNIDSNTNLDTNLVREMMQA